MDLRIVVVGQTPQFGDLTQALETVQAVCKLVLPGSHMSIIIAGREVQLSKAHSDAAAQLVLGGVSV